MTLWLENLPNWSLAVFFLSLIAVFFGIWTIDAIRGIDKLNAEDLAALQAKQGHNS